MAKKLLRRFLPDPNKIRNDKNLKIFGDRITNPNLWHVNRHSITKAVAIGLFVSYIPAPGHMLCAAFLAILFHANLPVSVILVWVSNPITIPPMYYFGYKLGTVILQTPASPIEFKLSLHWLFYELGAIAAPLFLGCLICGIVLAVIGVIATQIFWRWNVIREWEQRKALRTKI